ncbi:MAG: hypothetical protein M3680_00635 [Myxococcota bacterium]|nr:hypothetical protein [Myxococcota bacterium]
MTPQLIQVGSTAPLLGMPMPGRARVLVFVRAWSPDREKYEDLDAVRTRLRELDAELIALSPDGVWQFNHKDGPPCCDPQPCDPLAAALLYGVNLGAEAVFVIDARNVVRFSHRAETVLTATIVEALDAASDAHRSRERLTRLERVLFTPREWALTSLVVGCTLVFGGCIVPGAAAAERAQARLVADVRSAAVGKIGERVGRTRFARGTASQCTPTSSRGETTACAPTEAAVPATEREPSAPDLLVDRKSASGPVKSPPRRKPT